ncbi:hypothetical protein, partial [Hymenobacter sp.]|uniref:hypothetical protein n=1 Tax=Hymenobacter sp. TaxID=1898978 RepID=UPI00286AC14B
LDTDGEALKAQTMGVLVDWPGEAAYPQRFVYLSSESKPPACVADVLAIEIDKRLLDLSDTAERAAYLALWPTGKMPLLVDRGRNRQNAPGVAPRSSNPGCVLTEHLPGLLLRQVSPDAGRADGGAVEKSRYLLAGL